MNRFRGNDLLTGRASLSKRDIEGAERVFSTLERLVEPPARKMESAGQKPTRDQLLTLARRLYTARERRALFLPDDMFGEPGWDITLALYCARGAQQRMTVSAASAGSGSPSTTALRWIERLHERKAINRRDSPTDRRVVFLELEDTAISQLETYLEWVWVHLFPVD